MAVKGKCYVKTTWSFQERPVPSSKLNTWDDRIEAALELVLNLVALAWGGGDGVIRHATAQDLDVTAAAPPAMNVRVGPGYAFIARFPFRLAAATDTAPVAAPATHPRIDLVQARLAAWDIHVKTGVEAASPQPPAPDPECIPLARLRLRPGMTCIKDADDGVNGFIEDARRFV